jgi:hypothetical protein
VAVVTTVRFGRASATSPGKHGAADWRVAFNGHAPTHAEVVFVVGMLLLAEDRYRERGQLGRMMLWYFLDLTLAAKSPDAVLAVAEDCQAAKDEPPRVRAGEPR